jgi:hypothetical protein
MFIGMRVCGCNGYDRRYNAWGSAKADLKIGKSCGGVNGVHDVKTDSWQCLDPSLLVVTDMIPNTLVDSAISFRVIRRGELQFDTGQLV